MTSPVPLRLAPLLLLLLAQCRTDRPLTDQDICDRQANNDPVVKELIMKGAGNEHFQLEGQDQLRAAKQDARIACLRARGIVQPGGVERQKPP